jgi:hypothetical protein
MLWSSNQENGFKEFTYYLIHTALFFVILILSKRASEPKRAIALGWLIAVLVTLPIAFYEITFDDHLSFSVHGSGDLKNYGEGIILQRIYASVTFGNLNGYVTFLGLSLPFIFVYLFYTRSIYKILFVLGVAFSAGGVILINGSRGGTLGFFTALIIAIYYIFKTESAKQRALVFIAIALISLPIVINFDFFTFQLKNRLVASALFDDQERFGILRSSFDMLSSSYFMGSGIGSLVEEYQKLGKSEINMPHNFFLELLIQYGLIWGLAFILLLVKLFKDGIRAIDKSVNYVLLSGIFILPFVGVVNSGYWLNPIFWCFIASLVVFVSSSQNYSKSNFFMKSHHSNSINLKD